MLTWAQEAGMDTGNECLYTNFIYESNTFFYTVWYLSGFLSTARVTHATPAALYSHVYTRGWECDTA